MDAWVQPAGGKNAARYVWRPTLKMTAPPIEITEDLACRVEPERKDRRRQAWIDNLRTAVIVLVVNMHCCVTYSYVGDWYVNDGPEGWLSEKLPYIFWQFHLQSFFMGLLFFLSGALADRAIGRRGAGNFVRERLFRLGVPALLYMLLVQPLIVYGLRSTQPGETDMSWKSFCTHYFTVERVLGGSGPMWFALALLLFSTVFACWRAAFAQKISPSRSIAPAAASLWAAVLILTIGTAVTRGLIPVGTSVLNFQFCYFPQYVAAFACGVAAGKGGWLGDMAASPHAKVAGCVALIGGPIFLALLLFLGGGPAEGPAPGEHGPILYFGGWHPQAYVAALWEQFTGAGLALGMLALFRRRFNREGVVSRWLADRSFAVYVFHPPILVSLTFLFHGIHASPFCKIVWLTTSGLFLSFVVADLAKRLPGLRAIV